MKLAIEKLLSDPNVSNYQISKETGITQASLSKYSKGESSIGNMSLDNAIKLYQYYLDLKEDGILESVDRNILFGRLLGVSNVLGGRLYEKHKPSIEEKLFLKFPQKPMSTWTKIHDNIMQYSHKFGKEENYLLSLFDSLVAELDETTFTDEPLSDKYLLGYYQQQNELKDYSK